MREYGKPTIAPLRVDGPAARADQFFVEQPNQGREGELHSILARVRHFASRRNEVAHGIVFNIQRLTVFTLNFERTAKRKPQYALIPPYYAFKQHGEDGLPVYAYTRPVLDSMLPAMAQPYKKLDAFRRLVLAEMQSRSTPSRASKSLAMRCFKVLLESREAPTTSQTLNPACTK
jgi:hypothetical protein